MNKAALALLVVALAAGSALAQSPAAGHKHAAAKPVVKPAAKTPPAVIDSTPLPANAERLGHGRFDSLAVYQPQGTPTSFVMFLSGDGGWNAAMSDSAQALAQKGAMVAAIDTPAFLRMLERQPGTDCEYTAGDFENLSHFVQAYYKLPTYLPPIVVGYGSGATLGYANLAQGPENTFGGAVLLAFQTELKQHKPLCKGTALESTASKDGKRMQYQPSKGLAAPVTVLQGAQDTVYTPAAAKDFMAQLGHASVIELPDVTHDFGAPASWQPQFLDAFDPLAATLKPSAPAAPASLTGLPVIEVPPKAGVAQTDAFAILISGDGGWAGLDQEVAGALSAQGIPVVGVDSLRYFWTPRTPESAAADVDRIIRYYLTQLKKQQVLLVGYSQGADVMPFIINRLPAETRQHVALGAVMGLSEHALFEFHLGNWVNATQDQGLPTAPEMEKPSSIPMLCIYGEGETDTLCPKLDPQKVHVVKLPGGHHFGGDYERLAKEIMGTAKLQPVAVADAAPPAAFGQQTSPGAGSQSDTTNEEGPVMLNLHVMITPLLSLIAGILILVMPRLLNYIVAIYLIAIGALGLIHFH